MLRFNIIRISLMAVALLIFSTVGAPTAAAQGVTPIGEEHSPVAAGTVAYGIEGGLSPKPSVNSETMDESGDRHAEAARAHQEWEHEKKAGDYWAAGHLHYYAGSERAAMRELSAAGEAALNAGQVFRAAQAYVRAAYVATNISRPNGRNRNEQALEYLERARELADSPRVTDRQRELLQIEVDRAPALSLQSRPNS